MSQVSEHIMLYNRGLPSELIECGVTHRVPPDSLQR